MSMEVYEAPATKRRRRQKKQRVFEKLNEHAKREFREIDKHQLIVPVEDYQRDESEGRIAADIATHFDCVAFHVLLVIERTNGELVVADGGTRLSAAMLRDDITTVPCIVFSGLTEQQEADVFLRINLNRRKLRTAQQHHAELYSGDDLATTAQHFIDTLHAGRVGFDSLDTIRMAVKLEYVATRTVVEILLQVAVDKHVTARVWKGLVRLESLLNKDNSTLNRRPVIKKMLDRFGTFDAVVNVTVAPRSRGDQNNYARALAKTLHIRFPKA